MISTAAYPALTMLASHAGFNTTDILTSLASRTAANSTPGLPPDLHPSVQEGYQAKLRILSTLVSSNDPNPVIEIVCKSSPAPLFHYSIHQPQQRHHTKKP